MDIFVGRDDMAVLGRSAEGWRIDSGFAWFEW